MNTASVGWAVTPVVIQTFVSHVCSSYALMLFSPLDPEDCHCHCQCQCQCQTTHETCAGKRGTRSTGLAGKKKKERKKEKKRKETDT